MKVPAINKVLLPPKASYFFFFFSVSSITPFIAVFFRSYGLNAEQFGYIFAGRLFAQFVSSPIWGGIGDITRRYRIILLFQIVVATVLAFAAPWVPLLIKNNAGPGCQGVFNDSGNFATTIRPTFSTMMFPSSPTMTNETKTFTSAVHYANTTSIFFMKTKTALDVPLSTPASSSNDSMMTTPFITNNKTKRRNNTEGCAQQNTDRLFLAMIILFILIGAFDGGILVLIDKSVIETVSKFEKSNFGKQRLWGAIGFGLASIASGVGLELSGKKSPSYFTMFYIFLGSQVFLFVSCCFLRLDFHQETKEDLLDKQERTKIQFLKDLMKIFKKFHVIFFFMTLLVMGVADRMLYSFMFLFIEEINGSKIVMGLSILVACLSEGLMFPFTHYIIKCVHGNLSAMALAFVAYAIRFAGFSVLQNAWYVLLLQLLHSICFALFWSAIVQHTASLAPKGMKATLLGLMNGVFFGIAGALSCLIGGMIYNHFGARKLFRGYGVICMVWTFFLIFHIIERKNRGKLQLKEDRDDIEDNNLAEIVKNDVQTSEKLLH